MGWRVLVPLLGVILLGALLFSMWPGAAVTPAPEPERIFVQPAVEPKPSPVPTTRQLEPSAEVAAAPVVPVPTHREAPALDAVPDWEHLRALGLGPEDVEPLDGGVLHPITRDGIKGAVQAELPQIRECYQAWLQQDPSLSGKMKVEFTITEIPGRDRAKIMKVVVADGGMGHLAMEGCVRNVFKGMRFEAPLGGETRVTYPLVFVSLDPARDERRSSPR